MIPQSPVARKWSGSLARASVTLGAGVLASACQPIPEYIPATIRSCPSSEAVALPDGEVPVYVSLTDWQEIMEPAPRTGPADGGKRYYVLLEVHSHGQSVRPVPAVMYYSPEQAWMELDGKRIYAIPELWEAVKDRGGQYFRAIRPVPTPVKVNSDVKRIWPALSGCSPEMLAHCQAREHTYTSTWMIPFPVPRPLANRGTMYRLNAGPVTINGVEYPTPTFGSCAAPGRWKWEPIFVH